MKRLSNQVIKALKENGMDISIAESVTCGLALNKLSLVKGTSGILKGGICCYDSKVKCQLLKVDQKIIEKYTAESQQTTDEIAKNLKKLIPASICVAITGLASKGGSETKDKPVGSIFFSIYFKTRIHRRFKIFKGKPSEIQKKAVKETYRFILEVINT